MEQRYKCLTCVQYKQEELEGYYANVTPYRVKYYPPTTRYSCKATGSAIINLRYICSLYLSIKQTTMEVNEEGMVKIENIPSEGATIELKDLPLKAELIAVSEKIVDKSEGKAGGLLITFRLRDKRTFKQKYTKLSGHILQVALKKLKVQDTEELQKTWYDYALTPMRMGNPRMIPIKKATTQ